MCDGIVCILSQNRNHRSELRLLYLEAIAGCDALPVERSCTTRAKNIDKRASHGVNESV